MNGWLFRSWLDNKIIVCYSNIWYSDDDVTFNLAFFRLAGRGMETTSQEYDMDDVMVSRFDFIRIYSHFNLNLNHVYVSALLSSGFIIFFFFQFALTGIRSPVPWRR